MHPLLDAMAGIGLMTRPDSVDAKEEDMPDTLDLGITEDFFSSEHDMSFDTVYDESFIDKLPAPAQETASKDPPAAWQAGIPERLLFSATNHESILCSDEKEVRDLLVRTFADCLDVETIAASTSLKEMIQQIETRTNYTLVYVHRVQNIVRYKMHQMFKDAHELSELPERLVFHGTNFKAARMISHEGFRGAACTRYAFGTGLYCTESKWTALQYADPIQVQDPVHDGVKCYDNVQSMIVADMVQGHTTKVGEAGMLDFGRDEQDREIMTAVNPSGSFICVKYEDQLFPRYRIAVRYMEERALTPDVDTFVSLWNPSIFRKFVQPARAVFQSTAGEAAPPTRMIASIAPAASFVPPPPQSEVLQRHAGWKVGDKVILCKPLADYRFLTDRTGEISFIEKAYSRVTFFIKIYDIIDSSGALLMSFQKQIAKANDKCLRNSRRPIQNPGGPDLVPCTSRLQFRLDPASLKGATNPMTSTKDKDSGLLLLAAAAESSRLDATAPTKRKHVTEETTGGGDSKKRA